MLDGWRRALGREEGDAAKLSTVVSLGFYKMQNGKYLCILFLLFEVTGGRKDYVCTNIYLYMEKVKALGTIGKYLTKRIAWFPRIE